MGKSTASGDRQRCTAVTSPGDPPLSKRKPDADGDLRDIPGIKKKKNPLDEEEEEDGGADGKPSLDPGKSVLTAADKGKGIMVDEEEDGDDEAGGDDSEDSSDEELEVGGDRVMDGEEDSDFFDDPLAEVDLENILPSRTRRRAPPPPGAYIVPDQDGEDSEDSE